MEADVMPLVSTLASVSFWVVFALIILSYIFKERWIVELALSVAALIAAILNTATVIIGGERSLFLTFLILSACALAYLHLEKASTIKKKSAR